jgi:hypothetical protein
MMNEANKMTRDRDAFVFYSAMVIAVLSLFIGHDVAPDTMAPAMSPAAQTGPARDSAVQQQVLGGGQSLVLAVSHKSN